MFRLALLVVFTILVFVLAMVVSVSDLLVGSTRFSELVSLANCTATVARMHKFYLGVITINGSTLLTVAENGVSISYNYTDGPAVSCSDCIVVVSGSQYNVSGYAKLPLAPGEYSVTLYIFDPPPGTTIEVDDNCHVTYKPPEREGQWYYVLSYGGDMCVGVKVLPMSGPERAEVHCGDTNVILPLGTVSVAVAPMKYHVYSDVDTALSAVGGAAVIVASAITVYAILAHVRRR